MNLIKLLYPPKCPFCGRILAEDAAEEGVCPACFSALPWTGAGAVSRGSYYSACVSPLYYRDLARQGLLRFKFRRRSAAGRCFGRLMARCVEEKIPWEIDLVTYVPLSLLRLRKRGYSQSRLLAQAVAKELGLPLERLLRKRTHRPAQSGLRDAAARRANVSGAFAPCRGAEIEGKTVLLIDDVITSGATLSECSRVLLTAGAERVLCATLCKARK